MPPTKADKLSDDTCGFIVKAIIMEDLIEHGEIMATPQAGTQIIGPSPEIFAGVQDLKKWCVRASKALAMIHRGELAKGMMGLYNLGITWQKDNPRLRLVMPQPPSWPTPHMAAFATTISLTSVLHVVLLLQEQMSNVLRPLVRVEVSEWNKASSHSRKHYLILTASRYHSSRKILMVTTEEALIAAHEGRLLGIERSSGDIIYCPKSVTTVKDRAEHILQLIRLDRGVAVFNLKAEAVRTINTLSKLKENETWRAATNNAGKVSYIMPWERDFEPLIAELEKYGRGEVVLGQVSREPKSWTGALGLAPELSVGGSLLINPPVTGQTAGWWTGHGGGTGIQAGISSGAGPSQQSVRGVGRSREEFATQLTDYMSNLSGKAVLEVASEAGGIWAVGGESLTNINEVGESLSDTGGDSEDSGIMLKDFLNQWGGSLLQEIAEDYGKSRKKPCRRADR